MASVPRLLVLWDIDHTLIETRGVGRAIYDRAFLAATGRRLVELAAVSGRTERDIMRESLRRNGVAPTDDAIGKLADALIRGYDEARDELRAIGRVLPGAAETLAVLANEPAVHQSVLSGNLRAVARIKLEVFGLERFLDLDTGAYGEEASERVELVGRARNRARARTNVDFTGERTVLIGDTTNDVRAGLAAGAWVIAVASGSATADELSAAGAATVIRDLTGCAAEIRRFVEQEFG